MIRFPAFAMPAAAPCTAATDPPQNRQRFGLRPILMWIARSRERRALADLAEDGRLLRDISLTPAQALQEAEKPFWRS